jgi:hypothetical protein
VKTEKKKKRVEEQERRVQEELRELRENKQIREIEYRTIEWPKDALYFSYEPSFLFLGRYLR